MNIDNRFVRELPADRNKDNRRRQVHQACYSEVAPTAVADPELVAHSREVAALVGLPKDIDEQGHFAAIMAGNQLLDGMEPYATCYGGHQFGAWAGQLGDGRAINLGEAIGDDGERWELQLKGAGPTPYSRRGDGRAVLRSSVRDMFYDGRPQMEPGAVVCRVAPSFLRCGHFQLPTSRNDVETLKTLTDFAISHHFPHLPLDPYQCSALIHARKSGFRSRCAEDGKTPAALRRRLPLYSMRL